MSTGWPRGDHLLTSVRAYLCPLSRIWLISTSSSWYLRTRGRPKNTKKIANRASWRPGLRNPTQMGTSLASLLRQNVENTRNFISVAANIPIMVGRPFVQLRCIRVWPQTQLACKYVCDWLAFYIWAITTLFNVLTAKSFKRFNKGKTFILLDSSWIVSF